MRWLRNARSHGFALVGALAVTVVWRSGACGQDRGCGGRLGCVSVCGRPRCCSRSRGRGHGQGRGRGPSRCSLAASVKVMFAVMVN